jgi:hypothetical protein
MIALRPYQTEIAALAYQKLKELGIIYLALETRTGKTLTALHIAELAGVKNVLFITKKKAIGSIEKDYADLAPDYRLTVINYESVSKCTDKYDFAIIDEAHSLGTFPKASKRVKDIKPIVFNIPVILMSATPSPESYSQLFHQFTINKFHSWNRAGNFYKWANYYVIKQKKYFYGKEINDYSNARKDFIDRATANYFITFTQKQAGFNRVVTENILRCDLKESTINLMRRVRIDKVYNLNEDDVILADTPVKEMSKIHQLSSGTVLSEAGIGHIIDRSKAEFIKQYFAGKKIAVFYKFKMEFELLKLTFENWTESPEGFQSGNGTFLGQFQSSREGIRLDTADALIFFNLDFSFLSYEQSKNRIISKDRDRLTPLYFVFSNGGIEEKIYNVVFQKKDYTLFHYRNYGI